MTKLGGSIRVMIANLSNPAGIILYGMYHESAEAMAVDLYVAPSRV